MLLLLFRCWAIGAVLLLLAAPPGEFPAVVRCEQDAAAAEPDPTGGEQEALSTVSSPILPAAPSGEAWGRLVACFRSGGSASDRIQPRAPPESA